MVILRWPGVIAQDALKHRFVVLIKIFEFPEEMRTFWRAQLVKLVDWPIFRCQKSNPNCNAFCRALRATYKLSEPPKAARMGTSVSRVEQ